MEEVDGAISQLLDATLRRSYRLDIMRKHESFSEFAAELEQIKKREAAIAARKARSSSSAESEALAKHVAVAVKRFNAKPDDGFSYLESNGIVEHTPAAHAAFLRQTTGLLKTMIGQYLGQGPEPFYHDVLRAFVDSFEFTGMDFDLALREFLSAFRLPGEAQKIDRMMEAFAKRYHEHNPAVFSSADTAYVLAFALIMLNTDSHNPGVKHKMTLEQFFRTTSGIDSGKDIDHELLKRLYLSITQNEIKMQPDAQPSAFDNPEKEGFLRKQGGRIKTWKKRLFLLTGGCLYYFDAKTEKTSQRTPLGIVPLENVVISPLANPNQFEITATHGTLKAAKLTKNSMEESRHDRFVLEAPSHAEREDWLSAMRKHVVEDPYFYLLMQKREAVSADVLAHGGGRKGSSAVTARRKAATDMRSSRELAAVVDDVQREQRRTVYGIAAITDDGRARTAPASPGPLTVPSSPSLSPSLLRASTPVASSL